MYLNAEIQHVGYINYVGLTAVGRTLRSVDLVNQTAPLLGH